MHLSAKGLHAMLACTFTYKLEHMGWCNQHSCVAEAYKTRGRAFPGRQLRHLVTSKAGCNQASGCFLSAVSCSRYTVGCMVGGLSRLFTELMMKTLHRLFLHRLLADQDSQVRSLTAEKCFFFDAFYIWQNKKQTNADAVLFVRGKFILVRDQWVTAGTAIRGL